MYSITTIASVISEKAVLSDPNSFIEHLFTDSRRIVFAESALFFAVHTAQRNGHLFVEDCYAHGVRNFVIEVSENFDIDPYPDANFLFVHNSVEAIQQLAAYHRSQFTYPIIGITGSNGKTIVKEWLYQLLHDDYKIVKSPKSYNSQTGVPLSVWQMKAHHNLGIFEAGISMPGEMEALENVIQPTIGIFTNIGHAHDEGFINRPQKVAEKMELFAHADVLIFNDDEKLIKQAATIKFKNKLFRYGSSPNCDLQIDEVIKEADETRINARFQHQKVSIQIPFADDASIENAICCWCVLLLFNIPQNQIEQRMQQLHAVDMRLQLKQAINGCYLINDAYSLDLSSLTIALDFLNRQQQLQKKTVILSDLPYGYQNSQYAQIAEMLMEKKVDRIILIGPGWEKHLPFFSDDGLTPEHHPSTLAFIENFKSLQFRSELILLKGARAFSFEKIAALFDIKVHQTLLEVHLDAMVHNLKAHQKLLHPSVKTMVVVKAFGYGSGSAEIASLLQFHKVDYLAVAYADEGIELRKAGITLPLLIFNLDTAAYNSVVDFDLEPEIFSLTVLKSFSRFLMQQGISEFPVHIKIDTGMHRLGFDPSEVDELLAFLQTNQQVKIKSVFSHFAASEDAAEDDFSAEQLKKLLHCCTVLENGLGYSFMRHIANSAGISRHPEAQLDMVRLGIGLYGISPNKSLHLRTVAVLKTTIAQIRTLQVGDTIGYNRQGKILREARIATLRIGYADGYPRALSNGIGRIYLHGKTAPVIGNICMDMMMVDITEIPDAKEGDVVELMGENIPVEEIALKCNTIPYEILTGIGQRVKRIYIED